MKKYQQGVAWRGLKPVQVNKVSIWRGPSFAPKNWWRAMTSARVKRWPDSLQIAPRQPSRRSIVHSCLSSSLLALDPISSNKLRLLAKIALCFPCQLEADLLIGHPLALRCFVSFGMFVMFLHQR
jgi:hypothetical protein